jgi:hypothetical protein
MQIKFLFLFYIHNVTKYLWHFYIFISSNGRRFKTYLADLSCQRTRLSIQSICLHHQRTIMSTPIRTNHSAKPQDQNLQSHSRSTLAPIMPQYSIRTPSFQPRSDQGSHSSNNKKP